MGRVKNTGIIENINKIKFIIDYVIYPRLVSNYLFIKIFYPAIKMFLRSPFKYIIQPISQINYKAKGILELKDEFKDIIIEKHKNSYNTEIKHWHSLHYKGWRKKLFFIFVNNEKHPSYLWKMADSPEFTSRLVNECSIIRKIKSLCPHLVKSVPNVLYEGVINEDFAVLMAINEGDILIRHLYNNRDSLNKIKSTVSGGRDWLALLHKKSPTVEEVGNNREEESHIIYDTCLAPYINGSAENSQTAQRFKEYFRSEMDRVRDVSIPFVIQHNDFQPENILYNKDTGKFIVLDWEYAMRSGLPLIDLLNFLVLSLSFVLKSKKINLKNSFRLSARLKSINDYIDQDMFEYMFFKKNEISEIIKENVTIYRKAINLDTRLIKLLFFIYLNQKFSNDKNFLNAFFDRGGNILLDK
jgi:thiamine kinase-like enzyme